MTSVKVNVRTATWYTLKTTQKHADAYLYVYHHERNTVLAKITASTLCTCSGYTECIMVITACVICGTADRFVCGPPNVHADYVLASFLLVSIAFFASLSVT